MSQRPRLPHPSKRTPRGPARPLPALWPLYIVRAGTGALYTSVTTNVPRRYQEHVAGGPKAARFLRAHPPAALVLAHRVGPRALALKVEYRFKQLTKRHKEAIVRAGTLRVDRTTGRILGSPPRMIRP